MALWYPAMALEQCVFGPARVWRVYVMTDKLPSVTNEMATTFPKASRRLDPIYKELCSRKRLRLHDRLRMRLGLSGLIAAGAADR